MNARVRLYRWFAADAVAEGHENPLAQPNDAGLPDLLADRGPCSDCGASMRDCWTQPGFVCCETCIHRAASTTGLSQ